MCGLILDRGLIKTDKDKRKYRRINKGTGRQRDDRKKAGERREEERRRGGEEETNREGLEEIGNRETESERKIKRELEGRTERKRGRKEATHKDRK